MKKKLQDLKNKYPMLKYLGNKYILVFLFFVIWILFLDNYSYMEHRVLNKEINELEANKKYYKEEIKKDSIAIKKLKQPEEVERYAREKYFMKRENEEIFIIEIDE